MSIRLWLAAMLPSLIMLSQLGTLRLPIITLGHRGDRLKIITRLEKRTDILHLVFLGENILFKESPPSIMVTRNSNWSTEILWYGTGYAKEKMLSPPKHPSWGSLHCWFCLKLLKNLFSFFLFFYSSFHVPDSGVSEQFLRIFPTLALVNIAQIQKNTILLTLTSVNIFAKNEFEEEIFYVIFFLFIHYYYLPFLDGSKKTLHDIFAFNNNRPQIEHIT
jgi:hypothetical protein